MNTSAEYLVSTSSTHRLADALGSAVRDQLTDTQGAVTLAKSYQPYGETLTSAGNGTNPFAFTGEQTDVNGLTYLRARYYSSGTGRFLTRDTWMGEYNRPLSLNRWGYVEGNPINFVDPTGNIRIPCVLDGGWNAQDIVSRVDEAEKYVYRTSDPMDTYVAAGIAIQCAGYDINQSLWYSGKGIAQITEAQTFTEWGKPIYQYDWFHGCYVYEREDEWPNKYKQENGHLVHVIRGYGLRKPGEAPLNPNNVRDAVELMKREIQLVTGVCGSKCTPTDIYIAAALAQNGPGFSYKEIQNMKKFPDEVIKQKGIFRDWFTYFQNAKTVNTKTQLNRFILVVNELKRRRWLVPYIRSDYIDTLK